MHRLTALQESTLIRNSQCKPANELQYNWPFGIDQSVEIFGADRAGTIPSHFLSHFESTVSTFEHIILGGRSIGTVDLENTEAILSTQFLGSEGQPSPAW